MAPDFKGPCKFSNYTNDLEPTNWIESYELAMDMLEGPARTWLKNLPGNSINSWQELKECFIKNFQETCKHPIVDLQHCIQREGESAHHWACRVGYIIYSSDSITASQAILILEKKLSL